MQNLFLITFIVSLTIILYVFIGYPFLVFLIGYIVGLIRKEKTEDVEPHVTLIISAFNEEEVIQEKLKNSLALDYPKGKLEIFVVSDASTDNTDNIVNEFANYGVRLIRQEGRLGKTSGLNFAVPQAKGEIIVFSDANAMYEQDAVRKLVRHFCKKSVGYVVGQARYGDINRTAAAKSEVIYWEYEIFLKKYESRLHSVVGGDGAIYAIRKELYESLLITDINDFVNPLQIILKGFRGVYEPEALCWENAAGSFEKEFNRKTRIVNRSFSGLLRVKSVMNPFKTGIFSLQVISHKLLRWFIPVFLLILIISFFGVVIQYTKIFQCSMLLFITFFWCSYIGYLFADRYKVWPVFYYPYYFVSGNIASSIGIFRSVTGHVQATWSSARANDKDEKQLCDWRRYFIHLSMFVLSYLFIRNIGNYVEIKLLSEKIVFYTLFFIICYIYFGYPVVLLFLSKFFKKPVDKGEITPEVSLLICAYNEEDVIAQKLENSFELDYPPEKLKIVIASDGSIDRTNDIVGEYKNERLVFVAYPERRGKMETINETVPKLSGEIIIFSDANTMYAKDAIKKLIRNFHDPSVGAVSADVKIQNEKTSFGQSESTYYTYERWIQNKESEFGSIIGADGGMYAIRRHLFIKPSSNIILDDFVISMNVALNGYRLVYDHEAVGYEQSDISSKIEFLRKSRVIAGAFQSILQNEGVPSIKNKGLFFLLFITQTSSLVCPGLFNSIIHG